MNIDGLLKMTLLDYPGHVACTVFLRGCNFCCPFCYNSSLIEQKESCNSFKEEDFFDFLLKRKGVIDGVAISGGEPLLQKDIIPFIKKIKELGFKVKLDTNGAFPKVLSELLSENLVDYVAMDIKNSFNKYHMTTNCNVDLSKIKESIQLLLSSKIDYEFRTTIVKEFHDVSDFIEIGEMIKGAKHYYLQSFISKDSVINKNLHPLCKDELQKCLEVVKDYVEDVKLRGVE